MPFRTAHTGHQPDLGLEATIVMKTISTPVIFVNSIITLFGCLFLLVLALIVHRFGFLNALLAVPLSPVTVLIFLYAVSEPNKDIWFWMSSFAIPSGVSAFYILVAVLGSGFYVGDGLHGMWEYAQNVMPLPKVSPGHTLAVVEWGSRGHPSYYFSNALIDMILVYYILGIVLYWSSVISVKITSITEKKRVFGLLLFIFAVYALEVYMVKSFITTP
jgi:hypothetical protein